MFVFTKVISRRVSQLFFVLSLGAAVTAIGCSSPQLSSEGDGGSAVSTDLQVVRDQLAARRKVQIARLHAYAEKGVFPRNVVSKAPINVFRDGDGHLCAVANLVDLDGKHALVDRTARTDNFVLVAEQTSGELHDWVLTSGFTREEIARIQAPYMPMQKDDVSWEQQENARLQTHFAEVERELRESTDASLDLAAARLHPATV
ncbi:MAG: hypothetical protein ABI175_04070 [Polyangiales bacterium]